MVQKRCRNGAKIRPAGETKDKIMEYRIMRLDAGNAEGGRVASGRRQLNGNAFLDSPFHRLPGDPLVVFCRNLSCFVVFCRPLLARAGKGEAADGRQVLTNHRAWPLLARFGRFLRGFWARAGKRLQRKDTALQEAEIPPTDEKSQRMGKVCPSPARNR